MSAGKQLRFAVSQSAVVLHGVAVRGDLVSGDRDHAHHMRSPCSLERRNEKKSL